MRVIVLQAGKEDQALQELLTTIQEVLEELQVEVKHIQLNKIPYYNGHNIQEIKGVLDDIDQAVAVVMASRVELLSISGSLCTFFEYCSNYKGNKAFQKPLFALTASDWRGERESAEYMLHAWDILGGIEFGKLGIYTPEYSADKENILSNVERMTESFYRMIKQDRAPMKSSDNATFLEKGQIEQEQIEFAPVFQQSLAKETERYNTAEPIKNEPIKSTQEKDIEDLANFFKKQLDQEENEKTPVPEPQLRSTKHMLSSLPHYFQGQYAVDFKAVIQYHLLSEEPFSGYVTIENGDCIFEEGIYSGAEVELTAQEDVFKDIFNKKVTAQKAFMLGQLKVRGNFMLLSKIDQMFKAM